MAIETKNLDFFATRTKNMDGFNNFLNFVNFSRIMRTKYSFFSRNIRTNILIFNYFFNDLLDQKKCFVFFMETSRTIKTGNLHFFQGTSGPKTFCFIFFSRTLGHIFCQGHLNKKWIILIISFNGHQDKKLNFVIFSKDRKT